jgi:hypothetical protein
MAHGVMSRQDILPWIIECSHHSNNRDPEYLFVQIYQTKHEFLCFPSPTKGVDATGPTERITSPANVPVVRIFAPHTLPVSIPPPPQSSKLNRVNHFDCEGQTGLDEGSFLPLAT